MGRNGFIQLIKPIYLFSDALEFMIYFNINIVCVRFDNMKTKRLITSYDEINDTFVGKIDGKKGYSADYNISEGVFLSIDKNNCPTSVFVSNASKVFNTPKEVLENSNVKITIDCNEMFLHFNLFIDNLKIFSSKSENSWKIPNLNFLIDANY